MRNLTRYKSEILIVAGFLLLPLLLYGEVSIGGRTMLPVDNLFQWAPWATAADEFGVEIPQNGLITDLIIESYSWKRFIRNSLSNGEIPLWNPYLFAGAPFLATGQHSAYYPFSVIFLVVPLAKAFGWYTVSQLWLAGVLMYFFGRVLGMRRASAALAGLVFQGCGFMVVSASVFPMILGAAVWLPLLLACIEKVVLASTSAAAGRQSTTLLWVVLGAAGLGAQILAGHIEITYYTLLIMATFAAWRLGAVLYRSREVARLVRPGGWLLGMVALGVMAGSIQLIPFIEVGKANFREGTASYEEVRSWAFPGRRLLTLVLPNFYGNPAHHDYLDVFDGDVVPFTLNYYGELNPRGAYTSDWGIKNYVEGGIYLGVLSLWLAGIGLYTLRRPAPAQARERRWHTGYFAIMSLCSLAFIFGTPLYTLLYYGLPFINQLHTPFRWVFPFSVCIAALVGFGADYLAETRRWPNLQRQMTAGQHGDDLSGQGDVPANHDRAPRVLKWMVLWGRPSVITWMAGASFWAGVGLLIGLVASRLWYGRLESLIERIYMGLSQAADAFPSARAFYSYEFRQLLILGLMLIATGAVLRVSRCPIFLFRRPIWLFMAAVTLVFDLFAANYHFNATVDPALLAYKPEMVQWLEEQPGPWRLTSFNPHGDKPFNANSAWLYDLQDVRGYDSIIPKQYTEYMMAIEQQDELGFNRVQPIANWESLNSPLVDVLGVKYIITAESIESPKLRPVWEGESLRIYENLGVAPRAYILPQTSTVVVADALAALKEFDPRLYVVVERDDLAQGNPAGRVTTTSPVPGTYQAAEIVDYQNIEVTIAADVDTPSWLVLNDSYFPGWKAFVRPAGAPENDEQEHQVVRVNGNFRGVSLQSGQWAIRFRYSPRTFQLGALTTFMAGIILVFALGVWSWRRLVDPRAELTNTRSIAKNSVAPVVLNLFNRLIDFAYAAYYLRVLGPADAGSFATAIAMAGVFEIVSNYGLDILLMREVSQDRHTARHYLLNTSLLRLGAAFVASLPMLLVIGGTSFTSNPMSQAEVAAIALIMVGMLFSGLSKGVDRLFYVYEKAEIPAAITTVTTILKVGLGVLALMLGYGFVGLAAASILTNVVTLLILGTLAVRNITLTGSWHVDWRLQRQMVRSGFPLMLIHLLQTVFISVDVFLLRFMLDNGEEVVGWYNSAYKWFNALQIVPSFFTLALFPIISREIKRAPESAWRMYQMSLKLMLLLALPIAAVTSFAAFPLVRILAGDEFLPHGARALQIVIWSIPIGWLNSVTNYVLIGLGLEGKQPRAFVIAVGFNLLANLIFIPRFSYVAASVTTILSEVVLLVVFDHYMRRRMPGMNWIGFAWRPVGVTFAMLLGMLAGSTIHFLVGLILGILVYPAGLILLRVVGREEQATLLSILPGRLATRLRLTLWKEVRG